MKNSALKMSDQIQPRLLNQYDHNSWLTTILVHEMAVSRLIAG